ncbi:cation diffusion facilitator family transporter [Acidocella sp.]|uniref:cation diffusion facilitator family transporter n=1 Tax=Acidocella sp. TaxID=50710 RepID=UPI002602271F|nr:cation diffusion facilitator family transporter [Acidocella sp.]
MRLVLKIAMGSIAAGVLILGCKLLAARISGSTALFSDALETLVNVASSGLALYALIVAARPADRKHQYGHAKAELISAVATGAMILAAAVLIFERSIGEILHPPGLAPLRGALGTGLALNLAGGVLNGIWAGVLFVIGRRERSPALIADAEHLLSDLYTTCGILAALLAASWLQLPVLDPLVALAIAVQIAFMGAKTVRRSISGLLDEAPPPAMAERISGLVRGHAAGAIEAHDLRMRQSGAASFLEFHLVVPGAMSVNEAHAICDRIEAALRREMAGLVVTIHIEPEGKAKDTGISWP